MFRDVRSGWASLLKMKPVCALFFLLLLLNGCATDPEDRDFFDKGWLHPAVSNDDREFYHSFFWDEHPGE